MRTLPWTIEADRFVPLLAVYAGDDWGSAEKLPIAFTDGARDPNFPLLQGGQIVRLSGYERDGLGAWQQVSLDAPTSTMPLDVDFGGMIDLVGADLPAQAQAGGQLPFTLHWQASAAVRFDYSAFAHLIDAQGNKVAQLDYQPYDAMGPLPTSAWPIGWPVTDAQKITLPPDLPPGDYTLLVGLYNWQSGSRLPAQGEGVIGGDAVQLGPLRVIE
jgi:hypothetical protein